jgi:hypothetical protein
MVVYTIEALADLDGIFATSPTITPLFPMRSKIGFTRYSRVEMAGERTGSCRAAWRSRRAADHVPYKTSIG